MLSAAILPMQMFDGELIWFARQRARIEGVERERSSTMLLQLTNLQLWGSHVSISRAKNTECLQCHIQSVVLHADSYRQPHADQN